MSKAKVMKIRTSDIPEQTPTRYQALCFFITSVVGGSKIIKVLYQTL